MLDLATTVTNSGSWRIILLPSLIVMQYVYDPGTDTLGELFWASCNSSSTISMLEVMILLKWHIIKPKQLSYQMDADMLEKLGI